MRSLYLLHLRHVLLSHLRRLLSMALLHLLLPLLGDVSLLCLLVLALAVVADPVVVGALAVDAPATPIRLREKPVASGFPCETAEAFGDQGRCWRGQTVSAVLGTRPPLPVRLQHATP